MRLGNAVFQCVQKEIEIVWYAQCIVFAIMDYIVEGEEIGVTGEETNILGVLNILIWLKLKPERTWHP